MTRHSILQGINSQPNEVVPSNQTDPSVAPASPAESTFAFDYQMANAIDDAEDELDNFAAQANPYAEVNTLPTVQIIPIPVRTKTQAYETIIHDHLTNSAYGTCYSRRKGYLIGLEIGQDTVNEEKQRMFKNKMDLAKLLQIREGLMGCLEQVLENSGDKEDLYLQGDGAAFVRSQHMVEKNEEQQKENKAIDASSENLKRRAKEMTAENEQTVHLAKRFKAHVDEGGVIMADEPVDLEKNEGIMSFTIRKTVERERDMAKRIIESELRQIEFYKIKIRESEARYKDLCRAHMLIYLELKREGWENVPRIYRRPGFWFQ